MPPIGLDAQADYEASLRLALGRRDRDHRPEHLALTLVALDPGVGWVLARTGIDARLLLSDLVDAFPPSRCNWLIGTGRRIGNRRRNDDIVRRYQRTTGRGVTPTIGATSLLDG